MKLRRFSALPSLAESMFRVRRQHDDSAGEDVSFGGAGDEDETDPPFESVNTF